MFKDDRMISFLTAIIVMVAIGTVIQRADIFDVGDDDEEVVALIDDNIVVPANALQKLDIFANDTGITNAEKESLVVLSEPKCGRVLARRGVLQYYASDDCAGEQKIVYTLGAMADSQTATVTAFVVSDQHPEIRPETESKVARSDAPPSDDSPKVTPFRADDDAPAPDGGATDGATDAASPLRAEGPATDDDDTRSETDDELVSGEPDATRSLPGGAPEAPAPGDVSSGALVADGQGANKDATAVVPDRPDVPADIDRGDGGTLALALVRPDAEPRGPGATGAATLADPGEAPDARPFARDGDDRGVADRPSPTGMKADAAATAPAGAADRIPGTGGAHPVKRATSVADLPDDDAARDETADGGDASMGRLNRDADVIADRKIAALTPSDSGVATAGARARVPAGTDRTPEPPAAGGDTDRWNGGDRSPAGSRPDGPGAPDGGRVWLGPDLLAAIDPSDLAERQATGRVPLPVARSAAVANLDADAVSRDRAALGPDGSADGTSGDEGVTAERKVAALAPTGKAGDAAGIEAGAPRGADFLPGPLRAADGVQTETAAKLAATLAGLDSGPSPRRTGPEHPETGEPGAAADRRAGDRVARPIPPRADLGQAMRPAAIAPQLKDDRETIRHDAGGDPVRDGAGQTRPAPRLAALGVAPAETPRTDLLNRSLEPDPIGSRPGPGAPHAGTGADFGAPGVSKTSATPELARAAALVPSDAATSYSFFTTVPRREDARDDRRSVGPDRPAGSRSLESADAAPATAPPADTRIAALPSPAGTGPVVAPGPALAGLPDGTGGEPGAGAGTGDDGGDSTIAALPGAAEACTVPPSTELEIRRAAQTVIRINAPCQADTIAELSYSGLRLAIPLDRQGRGSVVALGFEASAPAIVRFSDDAVLDFDIPFPDVNRIDRVAVVWNVPVALELHALEFGAQSGSQNHVHPGNRRKFSDVRRSGGGFLHGYRSYAGVGQNAQIYTHWKRGGARNGIVKLMIDYASRNRDRLEGTCGEGTYAAPGFVVLRSSAGRMDRPVVRRLAALPCSRIAKEIGDKRLISGAIDDLVIAN